MAKKPGNPKQIPKPSPGGAAPARTFTSIPFRERNGKDVFNASGIVPLADSRFVFCDNNTNDALLELKLNSQGQQEGAIGRLPLRSLAAGAIDDMEDLTLAEENGRRYIFASPSLSVKAGSTKKGGGAKTRPSSLLRIAIGSDGGFSTEAMGEFRDWFIRNVPEIGAAAALAPDVGGLNVEGLAWDKERHALLFGIRTPVRGGKPLVVPVRIKDLAGPWTASNLEALPAIVLGVESSVSAQGIRGMSQGLEGNGFFVVVANATSKDQAPFSVYKWDGNQEGKVQRLPVAFAAGMKPEGLSVGTIGQRPIIVLVDDAGGFQVVWLDRLPVN